MKLCTMALDVVAVYDCNRDIHCTEFHVNFQEPVLDYAAMSILGIHTRRNHVGQGTPFNSRAQGTDQPMRRNTSVSTSSSNQNCTGVSTRFSSSQQHNHPGHHPITATTGDEMQPEWCDIFCNNQKCPEIMCLIGPDDLLIFLEKTSSTYEEQTVKSSSQLLNIDEREFQYDDTSRHSMNDVKKVEKLISEELKPPGVFTRKPSSETLKQLHLNLGCNKVTCKNRATGTSADFSLFLYESSDQIIVMDIDGTITRSDVRGYVESVYFGMYNYTHDGIVAFLNALQESSGCHVLYLTSRPISHIKETRLLLRNARDVGCVDKCLPLGPVFSNTETLMTAAYREIIAKNTVALKSSILLSISSIFQTAGRMQNKKSTSEFLGIETGNSITISPLISCPFLIGIGNKIADAIAYKMAGMLEGNILIIDTTSFIKVWVDSRPKGPKGIKQKNSISSSSSQTDIITANNPSAENFSVGTNNSELSGSLIRFENSVLSTSFTNYSDPSLLQYLEGCSHRKLIDNSA